MVGRNYKKIMREISRFPLYKRLKMLLNLILATFALPIVEL